MQLFWLLSNCSDDLFLLMFLNASLFARTSLIQKRNLLPRRKNTEKTLKKGNVKGSYGRLCFVLLETLEANKPDRVFVVRLIATLSNNDGRAKENVI